jgi:S-adenosylmethionine hydrolase
MTVRAKFFVTEVKHTGTPGSDPYATIVMAPIHGSYGDGKENESWSKYTPSGKLEMSITNPDAIDQFSVGQAYWLDISPVD